jgi:hypothetical protein
MTAQDSIEKFSSLADALSEWARRSEAAGTQEEARQKRDGWEARIRARIARLEETKRATSERFDAAIAEEKQALEQLQLQHEKLAGAMEADGGSGEASRGKESSASASRRKTKP